MVTFFLAIKTRPSSRLKTRNLSLGHSNSIVADRCQRVKLGRVWRVHRSYRHHSPAVSWRQPRVKRIDWWWEVTLKSSVLTLTIQSASHWQRTQAVSQTDSLPSNLGMIRPNATVERGTTVYSQNRKRSTWPHFLTDSTGFVYAALVLIYMTL